MTDLTNQTSSTSTQLQTWVEKLLHYMLLCYGKRFTDQWGMTDSQELIDVWAAGLQGLTHAELKRGKDALSGREWPPTLPEFKKLCRPELDPLAAYYEAVAGVQARFAGEFGKWSSPAVYWAAMPMATDLLNQTYSQVRARWERALSDEMAKGQWDEIPKPALALPAPVNMTKDAAEKALQKLGAEVNKPKGFNHRLWAERILERERKGDKSLLPIQVQFARQAMATPETPLAGFGALHSAGFEIAS